MENTSKKTNKNGFSVASLFKKENLPLTFIAIFVVLALVSILVSVLALKVPVVAACVFVILEALLAACLNKIPLWIHGIVFIAQIVAGIMASQLVFMLLMALCYVVAIIFLFVWSNNE